MGGFLHRDGRRIVDGNGKEILMRKQNSVSWEIIPNDLVYPAFLKTQAIEQMTMMYLQLE